MRLLRVGLRAPRNVLPLGRCSIVFSCRFTLQLDRRTQSLSLMNAHQLIEDQARLVAVRCADNDLPARLALWTEKVTQP